MEVCPKCQRSTPDADDFCPHCAPAIDAREPAETPPPVVQAGGLGRREVILLAAAVIGSGAITLAALNAGGSAPSVSTSATAAPAREVIRPADEAPAMPAATWIDNGSAWMGNARRGIALELAARNETAVWMRKVRPLLVVRCVDKRIDVFVFTDSAAAMEAQDEDHTVRVAFDGGEERTERWPDSSAHDALFAPDGRRLLAELSRARRLSFGYTPHNAAPVVAQFDVAGLEHRLASARRHCQP